MPKTALSITNGIALIVVHGEVDLENIGAFKDLTECAMSSRASTVIVDFNATEYVCVRTYGILCVLHRRLYDEKRHLYVVAQRNRQASHIMALLDVPFRVCPTRDEAYAISARPRFLRVGQRREQGAVVTPFRRVAQ